MYSRAVFSKLQTEIKGFVYTVDVISQCRHKQQQTTWTIYNENNERQRRQNNRKYTLRYHKKKSYIRKTVVQQLS